MWSCLGVSAVVCVRSLPSKPFTSSVAAIVEYVQSRFSKSVLCVGQDELSQPRRLFAQLHAKRVYLKHGLCQTEQKERRC